MKIFISIKKKWLQHRVYKYTLKRQDTLSKSNQYLNLSKHYNELASYTQEKFGCYDIPKYQKYLELSIKCTAKSEHYKNISNIYLDKKLDLEEELQFLTYRKA